MTDASTHSTIDRRRFVAGVGATAGAAALAGTLPSGAAQAAVPPGASVYASLPQAVRVVDTRNPGAYSFEQVAPFHIRLTLAGHHGVPEGASAIVATVAAVNGDQPNFVTVFPAGGGVPVVSNLNLPLPYETNANLVTVKLGSGGRVDVYGLNPVDLIVDLIGYYTPIGGPVRAGRFVGLDVATRVFDTRPAMVPNGSVTEVDLSSVVPADASSAVINLTATECSAPGYCTVFPYSAAAVPDASSLNWSYAGATRASAVIVPVASDASGRRLVKVFTLTAAQLIVDVTGYFTGPTSAESQAGAFVPLDPVRVLDTRAEGQRDPNAPGGVLWPGWTVEATLPGAAGTQASSVLINLTAADTRGPGYLTVAPARQPLPNTSNVNWPTAWATVPNHAITRITRVAGIQVFTLGSAVIADLAGYFVGTPLEPTVLPQGNPPPPPVDVPWRLTIPGLIGDVDNLLVIDGNADAVTNSGRAWHWTGTGAIGEAANIGIFAHRTEAGGAFQHLQYLRAGDEWYVDTLDGRRYVYVMTHRTLTDARNQNILAAVRSWEAPSCSLVACTVGYDSTKSRYPDMWAPTSKLYRIVVTGRLDRWVAFW